MSPVRIESVSIQGGSISATTFYSGSTDISLLLNGINKLTILEFQTVGTTPAVYNFTFNDGDMLNYKITGTNGVAGEYILDRGFSPLSNGTTTIFDNTTRSGGGGGQSINLNVAGNTMTVTITGVVAETWNWMFEYRFSQF